MSSEIVFDLESDGLLNSVTKIHCLSYRSVEEPDRVKTLTAYKGIVDWFDDVESEGNVLIGHNIIGYDLKVVKKILGVEYTGKKVDTLPLSWYLNHDRNVHGLESYGEDFGVPKPVIEDWSTQTIEDYTFRCEQDTAINLKLWLQLKQKLQELYK